MRAAPDPRILTGWSGASPHVLRFPPRAFLRFPVCPPGSPPSPAFLWFPVVRRSPVRPLRPLPGFRFPFGVPPGSLPLSNLHDSAAAGRFRRRWSRAARAKVTSPAATPRLDLAVIRPALQMGSGWARWDAATESPVRSGRERRTPPRPNHPDRILPVGGLPGLVAVGEGLRREAIAGPHPGLPARCSGWRADRRQRPDRAYAGRALCPPSSESGGRPGRGEMPGWLGRAERPGAGGAGLKREAAAAHPSRQPGPARPLPGRCRRSR